MVDLKNPITSSELEPATFQLVAWRFRKRKKGHENYCKNRGRRRSERPRSARTRHVTAVSTVQYICIPDTNIVNLKINSGQVLTSRRINAALTQQFHGYVKPRNVPYCIEAPMGSNLPIIQKKV
jgi:hypothetical protein